jgi:DNA modification methylase
VVEIKTKHRIIIGDSRKMDAVGDESIHLIVTSPPYWQLKDYGNGGSAQMTKTVEIYIYDLQPKARAKLLEAFETTIEDENWDTFPIAIIERELDDR